MLRNRFKPFAALLLSALSLGLPLAMSACEKDSAERAGQRAGESIDRARERAREGVHDAAKEVEKRTDR